MRASPLLDEYLISQYNANIEQAKRFGLIKRSFRFEEWQDRSFLERALKEQGLEKYWVAFDMDGKPKH